ncbi:TPA: hypothetical protein ACJW2R_001755, partial [Streptococcus pneumoniae]
CFIMKLSYEDKVQIYELRKQGQSFKQLSKRFGVDVSGLKYMVKLIDRYGIEIVKKERLARKQRISFKANLKALKQWNSATQM